MLLWTKIVGYIVTINDRINQLNEGQKTRVLVLIAEGGEISDVLNTIEQEPSQCITDAVELIHLHKCNGTDCPLDNNVLDLDLDWNDPHISPLLGMLRRLMEDYAPELPDSSVLECVRVAVNAVNLLERVVNTSRSAECIEASRSLSKNILKYLLA